MAFNKHCDLGTMSLDLARLRKAVSFLRDIHIAVYHQERKEKPWDIVPSHNVLGIIHSTRARGIVLENKRNVQDHIATISRCDQLVIHQSAY